MCHAAKQAYLEIEFLITAGISKAADILRQQKGSGICDHHGAGVQYHTGKVSHALSGSIKVFRSDFAITVKHLIFHCSNVNIQVWAVKPALEQERKVFQQTLRS